MLGPLRLIAVLLAIELPDEFVFGVREAAWPVIRADFRLSYVAVGILLTAPSLIGAAVGPAFGLLADAGRRRLLLLSGGTVSASALVLAALARDFLPLLLGFVLLAPASGAFVGLAQAALMDLEPGRHEASMARWVLAGSIGVVLGPLSLAAALALGLGWRTCFVGLALLTALLVLAARALPSDGGAAGSFHRTLRGALQALKRPNVVRWLALLQLTDLLGDVFLGYLALYLVDVARVGPLEASIGVAVWSIAALVGDAALVWLLAHISGITCLRLTAVLVLAVFPGFLLLPGTAAKLVLLALLGVLRAGWYAITMGRLYAELPGASGTAVALADLSGLAGRLSPLIIGLLAQRLGLSSAIWLLLLAPLSLLIGLIGERRA